MYRFLLSPRWLGYAALTVLASALMVLAGVWQYERYAQRTASNARVAAAEATVPAPVAAVLPVPGAAAGAVGAAPPAARQWARVTATGRYDAAHQVLVRGRNRDGARGFEVLTPLRLPGGAGLLVDRGWIAAVGGDARARPAVPPPPPGEVTVVGRVAPPESGAGPVDRVDGRPEVRRISPAHLAPLLPYPTFGAYLLRDADSPDPGGDPLAAVESPRQRTWQNAGYVVQWWLFAVMTWVGFVWLVRREAHAPPRPAPPSPAPAPAPAR
ncbi:SURF1-like protein [Pilimelia terevasa]|uniref:SURF1-like protein n=1 Tax=Pilimelia terevasa TaxID=53372 RepID=A0A8J3BTG6_9ACTN|nr:SURF1 family protein [Pilimelia terevasa]GGK38373.1 SURF1-like protein [Pilimelia terevasa]